MMILQLYQSIYHCCNVTTVLYLGFDLFGNFGIQFTETRKESFEKFDTMIHYQEDEDWKIGWVRMCYYRNENQVCPLFPKNTQHKYLQSTMPITSRHECILSWGIPASTVRMPVKAETVGPIVDPQGQSLRTTNS